MIGIYRFYENWSTETLERPEKKSQRGGMFVTVNVDPGVPPRARVRI
jgi:hypothetical protein